MKIRAVVPTARRIVVRHSTPSVSFYYAYKIWSKSNYTKFDQIYIKNMNIYNTKTTKYENTFHDASGNIDFIL